MRCFNTLRRFDSPPVRGKRFAFIQPTLHRRSVSVTRYHGSHLMIFQTGGCECFALLPPALFRRPIRGCNFRSPTARQRIRIDNNLEQKLWDTCAKKCVGRRACTACLSAAFHFFAKKRKNLIFGVDKWRKGSTIAQPALHPAGK